MPASVRYRHTAEKILSASDVSKWGPAISLIRSGYAVSTGTAFRLRPRRFGLAYLIRRGHCPEVKQIKLTEKQIQGFIITRR
jgi:hypothetical protein